MENHQQGLYCAFSFSQARAGAQESVTEGPWRVTQNDASGQVQVSLSHPWASLARKVSEDWNILLCLGVVKSLGTTRAQNRSLLSWDTTHYNLVTQHFCGYCQVIQEDGATAQYLGGNPERPRFTPFLSSTVVLQGLSLSPSPRSKHLSTACPPHGEECRFTDMVSPAESGEQLCTEAPLTGEAGDMKGVGTLA